MQKKIVLVILFLAVLGIGVKAQEDNAAGALSYGVKGGLVSSVFASQGQKLEGTESRTGFTLGLYGQYGINDQFGVSLEALYVQEGTMRINSGYVYYQPKIVSNDGTKAVEKINSNIIMNCIEIPVKVNYFLPEMSGAAPKIFVGGSFDFINNVTAKNLVAVTFSEGDDAVILPTRDKDKVNSSFKKFNFGVVMGAAVSVSDFTVDLTYKIGTRKINDLATYNYKNSVKEDFSYNTLLITVGYNLSKLF